MKKTNDIRLNPTRPYVEGVHKKKTDPEFKAWFVENKDQFAPWFVKGVIEGSKYDPRGFSSLFKRKHYQIFMAL